MLGTEELILNKMIRVGFTEKVTLKRRSDNHERVGHGELSRGRAFHTKATAKTEAGVSC